MRVVDVLACVALVVAVVGFVVGLQRTRHTDEAERGLLAWMVLAWVAVAWLVASAVA
jgi:hypothetical protein